MPGDDPLAKLHKMSTTAGVGVGDYVAINSLAVTTVVLGLASGLALLDPILLAMPVIALIIGTIAVVQIRKSGGTQGGMILAILGILIALGCSGWVGVNRVAKFRTESADRNGVIAIVDVFGKDVLEARPDDAWAKFSGVFQEAFEREQFRRTLSSVNSGTGIGKIVAMRSNGLVKFETFSDTPDLFAQTMLFVEFQSKQDNSKFNDRYEVRLRKVPDLGWRIERLDAFFPPPKPAAPAGATDPSTPMTSPRPGNS